MTILPARDHLLRLLTVGTLVVVLSASECPVDDNSPDDGGDNGGSTPVTPTATSILAVDGGGRTGTVGTALANDLIAQVNDQVGNPMSGISVTFTVAVGGGSVVPTSGTTGSDGRVSTTWTLGTTAGNLEVTASAAGITSPAVFLATATADVAATLALVSGDGQNGFPGTPLANPIVVQVLDQYGNAAPGDTVDFSVVSGGGSITTSAIAGAGGNAQATWTLGPAIGANTAQASATGLTGSPIALSATATMLSVTAVSPNPLVEGGSATITGTGFDVTPDNNTVTVDGATATITNVASSTSMTITVPAFDCRPERAVDVVVSVSGFDDTFPGHPLEPMSPQLALAVGEQVIVDDPTDFCLQFAASAVGGDEYLIGVGAAAEVPGQVMPFTLASVAGASASPPAMLPRPSRSSASRPFTVDAEIMALRDRQAAREAEIRAYERRYLDPATNPGIQYLDGGAMARSGATVGSMAPNVDVGDQRVFRVPGSGCTTNDYAEITATARNVGEYGVWYTDDANPTADSLTLADINSASETFDTFIYPFATDFFGVPSDVDQNSKIVIVMTKEVNLTGAAGFVYSGDLISRESCTYSDSGEIFYGFVRDPNGDFAGADGGQYEREDVTNFLPVLIAHEFTHNIQISRRTVVLPGGTFPASWIAEGQATFAEEVVGHAANGNSAGNNYGVSVATSGPPYWYWPGITKLGYYFGYDGQGAPKLANAPEDCTLFGNFSGNIGICDESSFYGASWSMLRYLTDRFYSVDPSAFHKDLISANPSLLGVENVEAVTEMDFDMLFARWGAMLYTDDWVPGVPSALTMTSWDLPDVLSALGSTANLEPEERSFGTFSDPRTVRGGSHAYTIVSAAGARPALAIRVRDGRDDVLSGTGMMPILWIVRVQ
jgi:hypothetical protein